MRSDLNHTITYNAGSQCIQVRFYGTETGTTGIFYDIPAGEGPVATFYFDVSSLALDGDCADLGLSGTGF